VPATLKELDRRIRSVKNTQQITRAMKMVAAAKLRRAQDSLMAARPYGEKLDTLMEGLAGTSIEHPFFEEREVTKRLVVIVCSDKGLCGSYNAGILRETEHWLETLEGDDNTLFLVGRKGNDYFKRRRWPITRVIDDLGGTIDLSRFTAIADEIMHLYLSDQYQEIVFVYTKFISTLSSKPVRGVLLPMSTAEESGEGARAPQKNYIYEPSAERVLEAILPKSVRNKVYTGLAEAFTSEHGARMTSMGAATDNAGELIDNLTLVRNRARQAAITQEISEIVGGADALG
jgi:F-type H+-transporting ATPase subunit gamma